MAKVKILQSCGGIKFSYGSGEIIEQNEWTDGLINGGLAEWVEPPTPQAPTEQPIETPELPTEVATETPAPTEQPIETQKNDAPKKNK